MGTDIHMYLEKKVNGKWVSQDKFTETVDDGLKDVNYKDMIYSGRDYLLFSVLAGVRTFPLPPQYWQKFEVTGFPEDADPKVRKVYKRYGSDAHTASSLTLKQLTDIDWEKEAVPLQFDVTARQKEIFDLCKNKFKEKDGKFVQGVWKRDKPYVIDRFMYMTIKEPWCSVLEVFLPPDTRSELSNIWALVPLEFVCRDFQKKVIEKMMEIAGQSDLDYDDIRIVFWFDN
jgi:hypothetical protein